jgi:hypothetical protein
LGYPGRDLYAGGSPKRWFTIVAQKAIEDYNRSEVLDRGIGRPGTGQATQTRAYNGDQTDLRQRLATARLGDKPARLTVLLGVPVRTRTAPR